MSSSSGNTAVGTRRKLNPKLKKGYVPPPVEEHIIIADVEEETRTSKTMKLASGNNKTTTPTQTIATTTTTTTPSANKNTTTNTVRSPKAAATLRFEKYEKQHEAFIKQMETFMKSFIDFEKERLAFMREQFGAKNVSTTITNTTTTNTSNTTNTTNTDNKTLASVNKNNTTKATTSPVTTTTPHVSSNNAVATPKENTPNISNTTAQTKASTSNNVSSPAKATINATAKNKDPAVDVSPTKQTTKKTINNTTTEKVNSSKTSTTQQASNVSTSIRELTIPQDDIFVSSTFKPSPIKVVYLSGENKRAIVAANEVFDNLAKSDAVYGVDVLWNTKEEKAETAENGESQSIVPMRYILLCNSDTVYVYKIATAEEMKSGKIDKPLPVSLYKILTQTTCIKVSWDIMSKATYLYHNLNNTYVRHVSDIQSLFKTEYNTVLDLLSKELDLTPQRISKELKLRNHYDYSKELNNDQLVTIAKRCWLEYRLVEKLSQQQETKASLFAFASKNMIIED